MQDRFDRAVLMAAFVLLGLLGLTLLHGDQVGLGLLRYSPLASGSSRTIIQVVFEEEIDPTSARDSLQIAPGLRGVTSVQSNRLEFQPAEPLAASTSYTITLKPGFTAKSGRAFKQAFSWQFLVRQPSLVYLGPTDQVVQNLFAVAPQNPQAPRALTRSEAGIIGYSISEDGSKIVYSELAFSETRAYGSSRLFLLDVASGASRLLYDCNAACTNLSLRPDSSLLAFQRVDFNDTVGAAPTAPRVWLLDLTNGSVRPLFKDNQRLAYQPRWSPDGTVLGVYDPVDGQIVLVNPATNQERIILAKDSETGLFSPDGQWLAYPRLIIQNNLAAVRITLADLATQPPTARMLLTPDAPLTEAEAVWMTDSKSLIVARQPTSRQLNTGSSIYQVDLSSAQAKLLIPDGGYAQKSLRLSPTGEYLLFERVQLNDPVARPQLWLYHLVTGELKLVAEKVAFASWLP